MNKVSGFTLIEMSVVLIIIATIIGGVLTGKHLKDVAAQNAQISQIQKYQTAVNLFQTKYNGYLPGDIPNPYATNFGFQTRGTSAGQGDGNGVIEGYGTDPHGSHCGYLEGTGETAMFWVDLSTTGLIDGTFNTASPSTSPSSNITATSTPNLKAYFPAAKLGVANYIYVWSGGSSANGASCTGGNGQNYFGLSTISYVQTTGGEIVGSTDNPGLTVQQAYNIDNKIDDGLPQSGNVTAMYSNYNTPEPGAVAWAAGQGNFGVDAGSPSYGATTAATPYATTNCYDNNGIAGTQTYSLSQNAKTPNCALSFQFQTQ